MNAPAETSEPFVISFSLISLILPLKKSEKNEVPLRSQCFYGEFNKVFGYPKCTNASMNLRQRH
jgi:hypothetical protein